jgi:hypothetical protein
VLQREEVEIRMGMDVEQDIIALSRQKWHWMSRRQTAPLQTLFHDWRSSFRWAPP